MNFTDEPWDYLGASEAVDFDDERIQARSSKFPDGEIPYAKAAFEFVRDEIRHSMDAGDPRRPWRASDVLEQGVGLCYAKSHLYVAFLRLAGIPSGFCYQRVGAGDEAVVHGLVAVQFEDHWVRLDPRGDRPGVRTWFATDEDIPAYRPGPGSDVLDYPEIYAEPHPAVLAALESPENPLPSDLG
ncbi:transglutaminase family protein [Actinocorallia longicatena]|uniref:Transglutaminase domain-containing protein n=1 Tax=Actinocorallia longicatena TaxID=111803 RepID=A0ABP6QLR3_9ACTN